MRSSPTHLTLISKLTVQFGQWPMHVQSRLYWKSCTALPIAFASVFQPARSLVRGTIPSRCAMKSSCSTVELWMNSTLSMAIVGTSAIMARRREFAIEASVFDSVNLM